MLGSSIIYSNGNRVDIDSIDSKYWNKIENVCYVKLIDKSIVKHITIVGDRDYQLYMQVSIPKEKETEFLDSLTFLYSKEKNDFEISNPKNINWLNIDKKNIDFIIKPKGIDESPEYIILSKENNGMVEVYIKQSQHNHEIVQLKNFFKKEKLIK